MRLTASVITIVALGDSTTAGTPAFKSPIEAPPKGAGNVESQYAYWLQIDGGRPRTGHPSGTREGTSIAIS